MLRSKQSQIRVTAVSPQSHRLYRPRHRNRPPIATPEITLGFARAPLAREAGDRGSACAKSPMRSDDRSLAPLAGLSAPANLIPLSPTRNMVLRPLPMVFRCLGRMVIRLAKSNGCPVPLANYTVDRSTFQRNVSRFPLATQRRNLGSARQLARFDGRFGASVWHFRHCSWRSLLRNCRYPFAIGCRPLQFAILGASPTRKRNGNWSGTWGVVTGLVSILVAGWSVIANSALAGFGLF